MNSALIKKTLPNGIRLLMEPIKNVRSVAIGLWLDVGSRNEQDQNSGICHFLEHMFFKGSANRDALELADAMNRLGGHFNAFTGQEVVCINARLIDEQLDQGIDIIADIFINSTFPKEEIERERNVILEEYKMIEDTPDELVLDLLHQALWGSHSAGRPIIGTPETIQSIQRDSLKDFAREQFIPANIIISIAGAFEPALAAKQIERLFSSIEPTAQTNDGEAPPSGAFATRTRTKNIEQVQFGIAALAPPRADEDRYCLNLISSILGGGMSSRIFKEVREKRGLAYSIGTYLAAQKDTGILGVLGGTSPDKLQEVVDLCLIEIRDLYTNGAKPDELELAKEQMKISIIFALESTGARMTRLAEQEIYFGRFHEVDEILNRIDKVTKKEIRETAEKWLKDAPVAIATVGPTNEKAIQISSF